MSTSKNAAKTLTAAIAVAFASLAGSAYADASGSAQYQAAHPLGFEIPAPGTVARLSSNTAGEEVLAAKGVSPLGFEIPAPGGRGVQGPVRSEGVADTSAERDLRQRLAGIGGWNTP